MLLYEVNSSYKTNCIGVVMKSNQILMYEGCFITQSAAVSMTRAIPGHMTVTP